MVVLKLMLRRIRRHWQGIGTNPPSSGCMLFGAQNLMGYYTPATTSCCISRNDPVGLFLSKGLQLHTLSCTTFVKGRVRGGVGGGGGGIAIGIGLNGLTLKCCLRDDDTEAIAFHKGKGNPTRGFATPTHHLHLLRLRDFDIGLQDGTASADNATATANQTQQGASHHGSPHGFPDRPLPDKIVVAVDVDEGNFFCFSDLALAFPNF
ncbi:hypothetical protein SLA2020_404850 [Shorea laevis]